MRLRDRIVAHHKLKNQIKADKVKPKEEPKPKPEPKNKKKNTITEE